MARALRCHHPLESLTPPPCPLMSCASPLPTPPPLATTAPTATGLAAGDHGYFRVVPAVAVHVEPLGPRQSRWNADGELLPSNHITGGWLERGECGRRGWVWG